MKRQQRAIPASSLPEIIKGRRRPNKSNEEDTGSVMSTRKLAKELGLLRRRSQSSHGRQRPVLSNQIFSYLIVIDFESTCWRERNAYSQEIIEFPAVLLNTSTGAVESEFHTYVQPQEHPILSDFCTELTGITQMQVEGGIPLHICLSRFTRWLQNLQLNMGVTFPSQQTRSAPSASQKLCTFLTWSDWDLGVCLQYECKRKQLHKPDELNSWIDLRSTYRMFYNKKPKGLNGALQDLGIQFEGREHSGLDDSRNTAQLATRMMRDGCVMKITKSLGRTSSIAKPTSGQPAADKKSEKRNTDTGDKILTTATPSSSSHPQTSCLIRKCVSTNTKECQSLVSPKTLLKGTEKPLGLSCTTAKVLTATSPLGSCPLQHNRVNTHHFIPSSTTFSGLTNQSPLNHLAQTATVEYLSLETDDRCGSYDDVVIEGDDDVTFEAEGQSDIAYMEFDNGCSAPKNTRLLGGLVTSEHKKTASFEGTMIHQSAINDSSMMTKSTKLFGHNASVCSIGETSRRSLNSGLCPFTVPRSVTLHVIKNGRQSTGLNASVKLRAKSQGTSESSKKTKTPNAFLQVKYTADKTSTLNSETLVTPREGHKWAPNPSFKIFSENPSLCSSSRSSWAPANALCPRPVNTLSTCGGKVAQRSGQKVTSPLCSCGRRAKRQLVSNGGPNHGRGFYCCPVRRSASGGQVRKGCDFFKWESAVMKSNSLVSPTINSTFCQVFKSSRSACPVQSSVQRKSF